VHRQFLATPVGNERATLAARGVVLAPRGSARDEALREVLRRERSERFASVQLLSRLVAAGLNLPEEKVEAMLDLYLLELSQDRYRPSIVAAARAARAARKRQKLADTKLLEKVDRMTVADEAVPSTPRARRRSRGRP
jgi:hypothetical protein